MHLRTDRADSPLSPPIRLADGRVVHEGVIAAPGIYLYQRNGRQVRELVSAEVLSDPEWLRELPGAPLVIEHPVDAGGEHTAVTGDNFRELAVGVNLTTRLGSDGEVIGALSINATEGHTAIRLGKSGLSPRYYADMDPVDGCYPEPQIHPVFGAYDCKQVRRYGTDQIAICDAPRGGYKTHIRVDSTHGENMDPKEALMAALAAFGMPDEKMAEIIAALEAAKGGESAEPMADADRLDELSAKLDALAQKVDQMAPKSDSFSKAEAARQIKALNSRIDGLLSDRTRADSESDRAEMEGHAATLGHPMTDDTTWVALAVKQGARADSLTEPSARELVRLAAKSTASKWASNTGGVDPAAASTFNDFGC